MSSKIAIPEGYDLLPGRNGKNARKALALAEERGYPTSAVLTTTDGYLIPLPKDEIEQSQAADEEVDPDVVALSAYIEEHGLTPADVLAVLEDSVAIVEEIELPKVTDKVADVEAFAKEHNIDLGDASNNEQRIAAIEAEIERRTAEAEKTGTLTDGTEPTGEQTQKED